MSATSFSKNYKKLFDSICRGYEVVAFVDYAFLSDPKYVMRDVCKVKRTAPFNIQIAARGIGYGGIYSFDSAKGDEFELFEKQCALINLEYMDSETLHTQAIKITQLESQVDTLRKDAERYLALRRMAVELSLSHQVISQFVTNQAELDAAIKEQAA